MDHDRPHSEDALDEALEETFPASDAPGNTVETGIALAPGTGGDEDVADNRPAHRFELVVDGQVAFLNYERRPDALVLEHTEVPASLRGHHIADRLVRAGLDAAARERLRVIALCPFVKSYLRRHPG